MCVGMYMWAWERGGRRKEEGEGEGRILYLTKVGVETYIIIDNVVMTGLPPSLRIMPIELLQGGPIDGH